MSVGTSGAVYPAANFVLDTEAAIRINSISKPANEKMQDLRMKLPAHARKRYRPFLRHSKKN